MNGVFAVYKPKGMRSAETTNIIKKVLIDGLNQTRLFKGNPKMIKLGHGGSLDQAAEGVLVLGVGTGTKRLTEFLKGGKEYDFTSKLGIVTDTNETIGNIIRAVNPDHITREDIEKVLLQFQGDIIQQPPRYSALKIKGVRMSDLELKGELTDKDFESKKRCVHIGHSELLSFTPPYYRIRIRCGSGFYVRSLSYDIGQALGVGSAVCQLIRTKQGEFGIREGHPLLYSPEWTFENIIKSLH